MKKLKELILHIGIWKTGTTTIQNTLFNNALMLKKVSICYPSISENHTFLPSAFHSDPDNFIVSKMKGLKGAALEKWHKECLGEFEREIDGFETVIISSEFLLDLEAKQIEKLKYYLQNIFSDIKIVIYMRHPVEHLSSAINEQVKQGHYGLEKAYKIHGEAKEYRKVCHWINVWGKEKFIIKAFEKNQFVNGDLIDDFLSNIIELEKLPILKRISIHENSSLSQAAIYIADKLIDISEGKENIGAPWYYLHKIKGPKYLAPLSLRMFVSENSKIMLNTFKKDFGLNFLKNSKSMIEDIDCQDVWSSEVVKSIARELDSISAETGDLRSDNFRLKALLSLKSGYLKEAELNFKKSVLSGVHFESHRDYAIYLENEERYHEAIKYCGIAITLRPEKKWVLDLMNRLSQLI